MDVEHLHVYTCVDAGHERNHFVIVLKVWKTQRSIEVVHLYAQACVDDVGDVDDVDDGGVVCNAQD